MKKRPFTNSEWNEINHRRHSLIERKYGAGLTPDETRELERLQRKAERYLESFEGPSVGTILRQVRKLKRAARSALIFLTNERKRRVNPFRRRILQLMDKEVSTGLTRREKAELARLQQEGIRWTMGEGERHPPTARDVKRMNRKAREFTRKLLEKKK